MSDAIHCGMLHLLPCIAYNKKKIGRNILRE